MHIAGDFNLNLLDHNRKVHNFLSLIYQNGMIPTINKATRVKGKQVQPLIVFSPTLSLTVFKSDFEKRYI